MESDERKMQHHSMSCKHCIVLIVGCEDITYVHQVAFLYNIYFGELGEMKIFTNYKSLHYKDNMLQAQNFGFHQTPFSSAR